MMRISALSYSPAACFAVRITLLLFGKTRIVSALMSENAFMKSFADGFIDCPPSLGLITLNALTAANGLVIPALCEFYSLEGLTQLMNTVRYVKQRKNPELELVGVLVNMYDGRLTLNAQVLGEIKKYFGSKLFSRLVPRNVKLSEAPSYGVPAYMYDKYSKGARAYDDIAQELMERCEG